MEYKTRHIITRAVFDADGVLVELDGYLYRGPVAMCGGPSQQQQDIAAQQQQFYSTLTTNYKDVFNRQQAVLGDLTKAWTPILNAGENQYGLSAAEDAAERGQATNATAANYRNAAAAVGNQLATRGGGNTVLPSGTDAQILSQVAENAAAQESSQNLAITQRGYDIGRQNFNAAANVLGGVAGQYNPTGYAGQATGAGQAAFSSATTNYQEAQAASPWKMVGGILGSAAMDFATGGISSALQGNSFLEGGLSGMVS